jgi:hypothetical protein
MCCSLVLISTADAQGLDDLFTRPGDSRFAFPADRVDENAGNEFGSDAFRDDSEEPAGAQASGPRRPSSRVAVRDEDRDIPVPSPSDLRLVDGQGSGSSQTVPTAMQLRQARAMAESRARFARLEAARWGLRPTLRPSWTSDPMTSSHFHSGLTYFVPVYVWPH